MKYLELLAPYRKALIPTLVGGALLLLNQIGITAEMTVEQALTLVSTSLLVFLVPNKK